MKRYDTQTLALCAVLTALALALSYMEGMIPIPVPLPGFKLGLANIVTLFALDFLGAAPAFIILIARCVLGALFAGNASALIFSLIGGVLALAVMALLRRTRLLSVYGVSIGGAAAHNLGQVFAAMITLGTAAPLAYLPALLIVALFTGALTGFITSLLFRAMRNTKMRPKQKGLS
ncbi:MAG: Gx transporter family protein [Oscillospiraceae bacterium]|nr:Gx transporter family protein [Oscillospiraceae bacterium]